jgi:hypothetical protein
VTAPSDRAGNFGQPAHPRVHEDPAATLTAYPGTRRMTIEQRLAEIIRAFRADALSSAVDLNVDLDVVLCVLAQALTAALRARLPGYAAVTPDVIQRRFLETPGQITTTSDTITVRLERRAYSPVLRKPACPQTPACPGGAAGPSATSTYEPCAQPPAWKSALDPSALTRPSCGPCAP